MKHLKKNHPTAPNPAHTAMGRDDGRVACTQCGDGFLVEQSVPTAAQSTMCVRETRSVIKQLHGGDTVCLKMGLYLQPAPPPAPAVRVSWALWVTHDVFLNTMWGKSPHGLFGSGYEKYKLRLTEWQKEICWARKRSKYRDSVQMCTAQTAFSSLEKWRDLSVQNQPSLHPSSLSTAPPPPTSWQGLPPCPRHSVISFHPLWLALPQEITLPRLWGARATGPSQASLRNWVCQSSQTLGRLGSQQNCAGDQASVWRCLFPCSLPAFSSPSISPLLLWENFALILTFLRLFGGKTCKRSGFHSIRCRPVQGGGGGGMGNLPVTQRNQALDNLWWVQFLNGRACQQISGSASCPEDTFA